ncbi:helix-turn-helix domain-containing protein [Amycolatopsis azurea]|uniref:Transcriptional regulator, MerR family n=2 Tax=Amycolatopsis azurea DSM 43854 TaxID=1238180 RepID=M2PVK9_9PSEU|nr:MerR family transcriptional regulator [Amycolatopsis azurea]EMD28663.1 Transcriptional regulator, MerR family [Amycolatopsis azurea DSM 43854]
MSRYGIEGNWLGGMDEAGLLPIGEVAEKFGIRTSALRYYDELGLLKPVERRAGRRWYGAAELRRLVLIQLYADSGQMPLRDVARILMAEPDDRVSHEVIEKHVDALDRRMAQLAGARHHLRHHLTCEHDNPSRCPALEEDLRNRVDEIIG